MIKANVLGSADMLQYLLSGNRQKCSAIAKQYLSENYSIKDLYEKVFKVALYEVGKLWETNKITVAAEHMATAIVEGILNELYAAFEIAETIQQKVVLTCVENEMHQVGIKMVADVFEIRGWESLFIGTGIPVSELVQFLKKEKPKVLAISMSISFNYKNLAHMIEVLINEFPDLVIVIGGQAFVHIYKESFKDIEQVKCISNLYELENYLETI